MRRPGSARSTDPVRAYSRAAQALGRLDENRSRPDCIRGAIGGICARLANPQGLARAGRRFRDPLARGRSVVDRRRRPRPAASLRRILSHSGGVRVGDRGREVEVRARHRDWDERRPGARIRRQRRRDCACRRGPSERTHRSRLAAPYCGCDPHWRPSTRRKPLRAAQSVR